MRISRLGEGEGFVTGYYEPIVDGSRTQNEVYNVPVYRRPSNLFVRGTKQSSAGLPNKGQVFRKIGRRKLVPYYDRAEIEDGAIEGRGLEICWLKEQTDLLFSQIQGSARVALPDGSTIRINYDAHNGYPYTPVGRILIERNIIPRDQMSMQKIREWMEQNPEGANELRRQNKSYVFFREVQLSDKDEAVGAQGVPLTPGRSIAVDKALHVYGTPFFIEGELPIESDRSKTPFRRLMIGQDTGSAIVGPARADLYFGAGAEAGKVSGRIRHNARFVILVPKSLDPAARGRKMPVPDERPSEKIAKLFPQTDSVEGSAQGTDERCEATGGHRGDEHQDCGSAGDTTPAAGPRKPRHPGCRGKAGAAARTAARHRTGFGKTPAASPPPPSLHQMKRRTSSSIPELPVPPRRKRGLSEEERALWESVAKQVKPLRKRHRVEAAGRVGGSRNQRRAETGCFAKARRAAAHRCSAKAGAAAAGADRPPRAIASVARPEGDRCPARSARHDADEGASRAVRLSAARPP